MDEEVYIVIRGKFMLKEALRFFFEHCDKNNPLEIKLPPEAVQGFINLLEREEINT